MNFHILRFCYSFLVIECLQSYRESVFKHKINDILIYTSVKTYKIIIPEHK
ncbi:hypothetical protein LMANV2_330071 [Leptospira interrogans serovar Manilae]|uniref:Uncharacterized protein n=1 Tax=Leptospira interrogans serovar Manilae TaxID=214675 RepID=A0AAQ1SNZ1_LEPIR|nr:hypothetical protein LMANV2_330071 [Leptospira interrogans serovar Manilae]